MPPKVSKTANTGLSLTSGLDRTTNSLHCRSMHKPDGNGVALAAAMLLSQDLIESYAQRVYMAELAGKSTDHVWECMASGLHQAGDKEDAIVAMTLYAQGFPEAFCTVATWQKEVGRPLDALVSYERAVDGGIPRALQDWALLLRGLDRHHEAIEKMTKWAETSPAAFITLATWKDELVFSTRPTRICRKLQRKACRGPLTLSAKPITGGSNASGSLETQLMQPALWESSCARFSSRSTTATR